MQPQHPPQQEALERPRQLEALQPQAPMTTLWSNYSKIGGGYRWDEQRPTGRGWARDRTWQPRGRGTDGWSCGGAAHGLRPWGRQPQGGGWGPSGCATRTRPQRAPGAPNERPARSVAEQSHENLNWHLFDGSLADLADCAASGSNDSAGDAAGEAAGTASGEAASGEARRDEEADSETEQLYSYWRVPQDKVARRELKVSFCRERGWSTSRLRVVAHGDVDVHLQRFGWGWAAYHHTSTFTPTMADGIPPGVRDGEGQGAGSFRADLVLSPTMCEVIALIQTCHGLLNNIKGAGLRFLSIELYGGSPLADHYMHHGLEAGDDLFRVCPHHKPLARLAKAVWDKFQLQVRKAFPENLAKAVTFHVGRGTRGRNRRALEVAKRKARDARELGHDVYGLNWEELRDVVREAVVESQASAVLWRRRVIEASSRGNSGGKWKSSS